MINEMGIPLKSEEIDYVFGTLPINSASLIPMKTARLDGEIVAPPSKSYSHRAILIACMDGYSRVWNPSNCDDVGATINACQSLNAKILKSDDFLDIEGFKGRPSIPSNTIDLGMSGTTFRFILPIACLIDEPTSLNKDTSLRVTGDKSLQERPHGPLLEAIKDLGPIAFSKKINGNTRIVVHGKLKGGETTIDGSISSQFISSLLIACPKAEKDTTIKVEGKLVSKPYVEMTLDVLEKAGIKIKRDGFNQFFIQSGQDFKSLGDYRVHGDYSSAAFLIAMACLIDSDVTITDLVDDKQGDKKIIDILRLMGAEVKKKKDIVSVNGPFKLHGIEINCRDTPDLVPVLTVLGIFAKGTTVINDIAHLKHKESNRINSLATELSKLNVKIKKERDKIIVKNSEPKKGVVVDSHEDHRIAMALSLIGLKVGNLRIEDGKHKCISKSYPDFIKDMEHLGAKFRYK